MLQNKLIGKRDLMNVILLLNDVLSNAVFKYFERDYIVEELGMQLSGIFSSVALSAVTRKLGKVIS
jgi:hypothetical protein